MEYYSSVVKKNYIYVPNERLTYTDSNVTYSRTYILYPPHQYVYFMNFVKVPIGDLIGFSFTLQKFEKKTLHQERY